MKNRSVLRAWACASSSPLTQASHNPWLLYLCGVTGRRRCAHGDRAPSLETALGITRWFFRQLSLLDRFSPRRVQQGRLQCIDFPLSGSVASNPVTASSTYSLRPTPKKEELSPNLPQGREFSSEPLRPPLNKDSFTAIQDPRSALGGQEGREV